MMQEYLVPEEAAGTRIDKFLADACPDLSRSFLQKLLKESSVTADGKAALRQPAFLPGFRGSTPLRAFWAAARIPPSTSPASST